MRRLELFWQVGLVGRAGLKPRDRGIMSTRGLSAVRDLQLCVSGITAGGTTPLCLRGQAESGSSVSSLLARLHKNGDDLLAGQFGAVLR